RAALGVKVAVTVFDGASSATAQSPAPGQPGSDQAVKVKPGAATAPSGTDGTLKVAWQGGPQVIVGGGFAVPGAAPTCCARSAPAPTVCTSSVAVPVRWSVDAALPPGLAATVSVADLAPTEVGSSWTPTAQLPFGGSAAGQSVDTTANWPASAPPRVGVKAPL